MIALWVVALVVGIEVAAFESSRAVDRELELDHRLDL